MHHDDLSDGRQWISPAKKENAVEASKKKNKTTTKVQGPRTVELARKPAVSVPAQAARPKKEDVQSTSSQAAPQRLPGDWPEAPAPGTFSR